jgi:hypothetical protein
MTPINYGSIEGPGKPRKKPAKSLINHNELDGTPEGVEKRLLEMVHQKRAPAVAVRAAVEYLDRKAPKPKIPDTSMTAQDALRICDIYERIFGDTTCPNCGHAWKAE